MKTNRLDNLYNQAIQCSQTRGHSPRELKDVSDYTNRLFTHELPLDLCNEFRLLCLTAVREPKPPVFRSHRPVIGPVIVFIKRLSWRILRVLLKDTIESQQMFNRKAVRLLARNWPEAVSAAGPGPSGESPQT
jgi:hypothetical protein